MMRIIEELAGDWRRLDERIEGLSADITSLVEKDPACERLMTVPGIGPIISSAMVAAIGTGDVFSTLPRLRRLAWTGAETNVDRRPHLLGRYRSAAIATCVSRSCRRPGWC
jgi:transposase